MAREPSLSRSPKLTVALIVRDAEDLLPETLDSIRFIADELVVVDTGSTDRTKAIAQAAQAKVVGCTWSDDFSAPRNLALTHATGDWILWLDAGETMAAGEAQAIKLFLAEQAEPNKAYLLLVELAAEAHGVSPEQAGRIRLVPNARGVQFQGRVRERLHESLAAAGIVLEALPWKIQRGPRERDPHVKSRKARRDLRLAELEIKQHGPTARMLNIMGDAYSRLGDMTAAIDFFRRALQSAARGSLDSLEAYYGLLAACDSDPSKRSEQITICLAALDSFSLDGQLLCAMGSYLQQQGRLDLAARSYQTAVEYGQIELQLWHLSELSEVAAVCWSLTLQHLEREDEARTVLEEALARDGASERIRRQLIELYVKQDARKEALEQVQHLALSNAQREGLRTAIRGACQAARQQWAGALGYLQTAHQAGCREPLALRWLAVTLLALGELLAVQPILREWQAQEPHNPELLRYLEAVAAQQTAPAAKIPAPHIGQVAAKRPVT